MKLSWLWVLMLFSGIAAKSLPAAQIYTWTDPQGLLHISDRPPPPGVRIHAVDENKPPTIAPAGEENPRSEAVKAARAQLASGQAAWQDAQRLSEAVAEAQAAYEAAAAAVAEERAKYAFSARRRRAPRQILLDLQETARAAFAEYRRLLDEYNNAVLAAREAEAGAMDLIETVDAPAPASPQTPSPGASPVR